MKKIKTVDWGNPFPWKRLQAPVVQTFSTHENQNGSAADPGRSVRQNRCFGTRGGVLILQAMCYHPGTETLRVP